MDKLKLVVVVVSAFIGAAIGFFATDNPAKNAGLGAFFGALIGSFIIDYARD